MISIAICDNEDVFLDHYEAKLQLISKKLNVHLDIIRFSSGESLLFFLEDEPDKFQLIYLDIVMGGINGIETALNIRKLNTFVKIVFLTSSTDFVYNAFDANASNYLIKDLHDNKFDDVFVSILNQLIKREDVPVLTIKTQQKSILVPFNEIAYFESFKRLLICHKSNNQKVEYYYKMSDLALDLQDKHFILVHRSFFVNMQYILKLTRTDVYLKNGVMLPVSRNSYETVKSALLHYTNKK